MAERIKKQIVTKLSAKMKEVIEKMRGDWELAKSISLTGHAWIQKGGTGKGGESKAVNASTLQALYDRNLIFVPKGRENYRLERYELTSLGKTIQL